MQFCGAQLREARTKAGLTQPQLAGLVDVSVDTIRRAETGAFDPRAETIGRLAAALEISVSDLFDAPEAVA
jgi:putative transcriptional regulator